MSARPVPVLPGTRWCLPVSALLLVACGGGGGGGDDDESLALLLGDYSYTIANPAAGPSPLLRTVVSPTLTDEYLVDAGTGSVRGTWTAFSDSLTIADGSSYTVDWTQAGPAPDWQRVASRASQALVDLLLPAFSAIAILEGIYDGEFDNGPLVSACDTIPGSPPAGVGVQTGEIQAQELNSDNYRVTRAECFSQSGSFAGSGALNNGAADFRNLVFSTAGDLIDRFGFEATASQPGQTLDPGPPSP